MELFMARRKEFMAVLAQTARAAQQQRIRISLKSTQLEKEAERASNELDAFLNAVKQQLIIDSKQRKAIEKEIDRLLLVSQTAHVVALNQIVEEEVEQLNEILKATLTVDDFLDFESLKKRMPKPGISLTEAGQVVGMPPLESILPLKPSGIRALLPGIKQEYERETTVARENYKQQVLSKLRKISTYNAEIEQFKTEFNAANPEAIVDYFALVLETSSYPKTFPKEAKLAYVPESKQLVIEFDLPPFEAIPEVASYKFVKSKGELTTTNRPAAQRKTLYASVTAQIALRTIHELFEADRSQHLDTIVFNGYVDSIDKGTGLLARTCLITVRTTRDVFTKFNLSKVDPLACLKTLNAGVSKSPAELVPVRPVLEFNMVDPRFVQETDVLSTLDQRPNLMNLTPSEFESLITNLFEKMGLETRLTQASRDGGVDCVAYDPRPIFGGKVVIQAKRYKHTVGVSAVRDLYGTMQNEGASKGILVTTSGYGKAAFEFAEGKPLELLSGSNLLYLLAQHANIEAKIEPPDNWKDPVPDSGDN
jgi:restriction system protein